MSAYDIDAGVRAAVADFKLPERLGFGDVNAPVMFEAEWREGAWQRGRLRPYGPIEVWPGSRALQYAELVFEGLKAYRVERSQPNLFRADEDGASTCRAKLMSLPGACGSRCSRFRSGARQTRSAGRKTCQRPDRRRHGLKS